MKRFPRPARRTQIADYELTEQGQQAALPTEPIPYEVTLRGQGEYLPTQGKFKEGEDERRHTFTPLECSIGGHVAMLNNLIHFGNAYAETDEEWELLAGSRLDTILRLRGTLHGHCIVY